MPSTAYQIGRLLVALDRAGVIRDVERAYEQTCRIPASLLPAIAQATEQPAARELIAPIMETIPADASPFVAEPLVGAELGDFSLGYYHQRAQFRTGVLPEVDDEPPLTTTYFMRIDPELKTWIDANGGAKLVRALLRTAYERHQQ